MDDLYSKPCPTIQGCTDFILRNRLGERMNPHCLNRAIERICRDYNAQEMEPDYKFIQQVMGHADISTTMDIYTHITQEKMMSTAQSISKNLSLF